MTSAAVDAALAQTPDLLQSALARVPEDQWFERKSARVSPRDLAVPLVAMANADGGVLVVGGRWGADTRRGRSRRRDGARGAG